MFFSYENVHKKKQINAKLGKKREKHIKEIEELWEKHFFEKAYIFIPCIKLLSCIPMQKKKEGKT